MPYNPHKYTNRNQDDNRNELSNRFSEGAKRAGRGASNLAKNSMKKALKKGINAKFGLKAKASASVTKALAGLIGIKGVIIISVLILLLMMFLAIVDVEFKGKNQDYAENGTVGEVEASKEGKTASNNDDMQVKQFYQYSSNKSYWKLINEKLLPADEETQIKDYYNREQLYNLSPAFLKSLNTHLLKDEIIYPEQFIQPVYHEIVNEVINGKATGKKTAIMKDLTDNRGNVVAESKVNKFKITKEEGKTYTNYWGGDYEFEATTTVKSVANYGLGSIIRYQKGKKVQYMTGTYVDDIWTGSPTDGISKLTKSAPVAYGPDGFNEPAKNYEKWNTGKYVDNYYCYDETYNKAEEELEVDTPPASAVTKIDYVYEVDDDIYLMDDVLSFWGKYTFTYSVSPKIFSEQLPTGYNQKKIGSIIYNLKKESYNPKRFKKEISYITDPVTELQVVEKDANGKTVYVNGDEIFNITWNTENLYRQYSGAVYEIMPRINQTYFNSEEVGSYLEKMGKENKSEKEEKAYQMEIDKKFEYLKGYCEYFEAYIPENVTLGFDFEERVGSAGSTYAFDTGNVGNKELSSNVTRYSPLFEKYSNGNPVVKDLLMAKCMQESGGVNIHDGFSPNYPGKTYPAWGIMQIEDVSSAKIYPYTRGTALGASVRITKKTPGEVDMDERLDPEKAIKWASDYYFGLLKSFNGDMLKALQAYNYGEGGMKKLSDYADSIGVNWLSITNMMPDLLGKTKHGDPNYVPNVLKYFKGDVGALTNQDLGFFAGILNKMKDLFKKYDLENQPLIFYKYVQYKDDFEFMMREATALDQSVLLSDADYENYGFMLDGDGTDANQSINSIEDLKSVIPTLGDFISPLGIKNPPMSSPFGWRIHPTLKTRKYHNGIDIAVAVGTPLYAIGDGVLEMGSDDVSGNFIRIKHSDGITSVYVHMHAFSNKVKNGQSVVRGEFIGITGNTGRSTGPHLHFGVKKDGQWIDPYYFVYPPDKNEED